MGHCSTALGNMAFSCAVVVLQDVSNSLRMVGKALITSQALSQCEDLKEYARMCMCVCVCIVWHVCVCTCVCAHVYECCTHAQCTFVAAN